MDFSDFIVFVDESGDSSLDSISSQYPIFVLAFCVIEKKHYYEYVVPRVEKLKFDTFGTDIPILHEREIRQRSGVFNVLMRREVRDRFFSELNDIMMSAQYRVVAAVIDKTKYVNLPRPRNVYSLAVQFGIERVFYEMQDAGQKGKRVPIVFESRGRKEDKLLHSEFDTIVSSSNLNGINEMFDFYCADKKANLAGLQFADLIARPIGNKYLHKDSHDRSYEILRSKLRHDGFGRAEGYGIKIYP